MADLECPLCLDTFNDPRILSCGHSFCKKCILDLRERFSEPAVPCPECKVVTQLPEGVEKLLVNWTVQRALNSSSSKLSTSSGPVSSPTPPLTANCPLHSVPAILFCSTCVKLICPQCLAHHSSHLASVGSLESSLATYCNLMNEMESKASESVAKCEQQLNHLVKMKENAKDALSEQTSHISGLVSRAIEALQTRECELVAEMTQSAETLNEALDLRISNLSASSAHLAGCSMQVRDLSYSAASLGASYLDWKALEESKSILKKHTPSVPSYADLEALELPKLNLDIIEKVLDTIKEAVLQVEWGKSTISQKSTSFPILPVEEDRSSKLPVFEPKALESPSKNAKSLLPCPFAMKCRERSNAAHCMRFSHSDPPYAASQSGSNRSVPPSPSKSAQGKALAVSVDSSSSSSVEASAVASSSLSKSKWGHLLALKPNSQWDSWDIKVETTKASPFAMHKITWSHLLSSPVKGAEVVLSGVGQHPTRSDLAFSITSRGWLTIFSVDSETILSKFKAASVEPNSCKLLIVDNPKNPDEQAFVVIDKFKRRILAYTLDGNRIVSHTFTSPIVAVTSGQGEVIVGMENGQLGQYQIFTYQAFVYGISQQPIQALAYIPSSTKGSYFPIVIVATQNAQIRAFRMDGRFRALWTTDILRNASDILLLPRTLRDAVPTTQHAIEITSSSSRNTSSPLPYPSISSSSNAPPHVPESLLAPGLAISREDGQILVLSSHDGLIVHSIEAHPAQSTCMAVSKWFIITGGCVEDPTLKFWDWRTGTLRVGHMQCKAGVCHVETFANGTMCISICRDGTAYFVHLGDKKIAPYFQEKIDLAKSAPEAILISYPETS